MILRNLSEKQVDEILLILEKYKMRFTVKLDDDVLESNMTSLKNDIRHFTGPDLSTDILSIEINEEDFNDMPEVTKNELSEYVYLGEVPEEMQGNDHIEYSFQKEMRSIQEFGKKSSIAAWQILLIILGISSFLLSGGVDVLP